MYSNKVREPEPSPERLSDLPVKRSGRSGTDLNSIWREFWMDWLFIGFILMAGIVIMIFILH